MDGARELHDLLYRLGRYIAISNFIAETTVKDFGRLHPLQRLVSGRGIYAAKLVAGRRRTHPLPILTAADYTLASIELRTNKEDRRKDPASRFQTLMAKWLISCWQRMMRPAIQMTIWSQ